MEGAATIGATESVILDQALAAGWNPSTAPARRNGRHATLIGAGPAGLACAERLNAAGWTVSVYDRNREIGGLLTTGVPPFKLDKSLFARRRSWLEAAGVRFDLGIEVDAALVKELQRKSDALFLGTGAQLPRLVELPGRDRSEVLEALNLLAAVNAGHPPDLRGGRVLILGGGDTAMDCTRSALRLGAASVTLAYRGPEERLRAAPEEIHAARDEGARFLFDQVPLAVEGGERVQAVRFDVPGGGEVIACDWVFPAFGQQPDPPTWLNPLGVLLHEDGRIRVDGQGRMTKPQVYAGGDNTHGPDLVVTALAAGRRAADAILADRRSVRHMSGAATRRQHQARLFKEAAL